MITPLMHLLRKNFSMMQINTVIQKHGLRASMSFTILMQYIRSNHGCYHQQLLEDGQIKSLIPDWHPLGSFTLITVDEKA